MIRTVHRATDEEWAATLHKVKSEKILAEIKRLVDAYTNQTGAGVYGAHYTLDEIGKVLKYPWLLNPNK